MSIHPQHAPAGWKIRKVCELGELVGGATPSTTEDRYFGGDIVWLAPSDLTPLSDAEIYISNSTTKLTAAGFKSCSTRMLPQGAICMSSRATLGECAIAAVPLCTNQGFISIVCKPEIDNRFLLYWIKHNTSYISRFSAGTTFLEIPRRTFGRLRVCLPNTQQEQARIADLINTLDRTIVITQASIDATQKLKRGLMQNLLTGKLKPDGTWRRNDEFDIDPKFGRVPKGWRWTRVKESLAEQPSYGANASAIPYHSDMARFIRITDIDDEGNLIVEGKTSIDVSADSDYVLQDGDIVIARTGDTVGKSLLFHSDYGFCAYAGYLIRLRFDKTKCLSNYFELVLHSDLFEAFKIAMQRVGAKPNINAREYANFAFPKPESTVEQQTIVAVGNSLADVVHMRKEKLMRLQSLKKALMQNLLTGKVRIPPDLNIE